MWGRISPKVKFLIPLQRLTQGILFSFTLGETENSIAGEALVVAGGGGKAFSGIDDCERER